MSEGKPRKQNTVFISCLCDCKLVLVCLTQTVPHHTGTLVQMRFSLLLLVKRFKFSLEKNTYCVHEYT